MAQLDRTFNDQIGQWHQTMNIYFPLYMGIEWYTLLMPAEPINGHLWIGKQNWTGNSKLQTGINGMIVS